MKGAVDTQALAAVRDERVPTAASEAVQRHIQRRVAGFPAAAKEALHTAHAVLPRNVAAVLRAQPQLVAPAVEAFFYRDGDDLKVSARCRDAECRHSTATPPDNRPVRPSCTSSMLEPA
jgi:hypothetical protein